MHPASEPAPTLADIRDELRRLSDLVGKESEDGKSGTGLVGEVRRTSQKLEDITSLRDRAFGFVGAFLFIAGILGFTFRQGLMTLAFGGHK